MSPGQPPSIDFLWAEYTKTRSVEIRDKLIEHYLPFVRRCAYFVAAKLPSHLRYDLASCGVFGLIRAVENFDPWRGVLFEAYARTKILGAIYDELRRNDFLPRRVRRKIKELERATGRLISRLDREPTPEELAAELGLAAEEVVAFEEELSQVPDFVSLDGFYENGKILLVRDPNVVGQLDQVLQEEKAEWVQAAL